jgi:hypothetical protein
MMLITCNPATEQSELDSMQIGNNSVAGATCEEVIYRFKLELL